MQQRFTLRSCMSNRMLAQEGDFSWRNWEQLCNGRFLLWAWAEEVPQESGMWIFATHTGSFILHSLSPVLWQGAWRENVQHATVRFLRCGCSLWEAFSNSQKVNWCPPGTLIYFIKTCSPWREAKSKANRLHEFYIETSERKNPGTRLWNWNQVGA